MFDGILQEVVLFCGVVGGATGGPAHIRTVTLHDADALADADLDRRTFPVGPVPALLHEKEKWTRYFLDPAAIADCCAHSKTPTP